MKTLVVSCILYLCINIESSCAQDLAGTWHGHIEVMGSELPLVFTLGLQGGVYEATFRSPKQSNESFDVEQTVVIADSIHLDMTSIGAAYQGVVKGDSIVGKFSQLGNSIDLILHKGDYMATKIVKPQDPIPPFPYRSEEVAFANIANSGSTLAGTLTMPEEMEKSTPVAIMISGSGPQDRNEEIVGHKPFLVLADHLTREGIAVLRYDDRGTAASEGDHSTATSFDFATDVEAAILYLQSRPEFKESPLGLIGHSEGGLIAPIVIQKRPDDVDFFVSLAGPGVDGKQILVSQTVAGLQVVGANADVVAFDSLLTVNLCDRVLKGSQEMLEQDLQAIVSQQLLTAEGYNKAKYNKQMQDAVVRTYCSPWMVAFIQTDPTKYLSSIMCPTLLLNGEKDVQVLPDLNLTAMEQTLLAAGNKDVTAIKLQGLNHLFQTATTGSTFEYGKLEETLSPKVLDLVATWINDRF